MRPLTADVPKCLVEVNGVPILFRSLRVLASAGVTEAVIVVGHEAAQVRRRIGHHLRRDRHPSTSMRPASTRRTTFARCGTPADTATRTSSCSRATSCSTATSCMRLREQLGSSMAVAARQTPTSRARSCTTTPMASSPHSSSARSSSRAGDEPGDRRRRAEDRQHLSAAGRGAADHDPARAVPSGRRRQRAGLLRDRVPRPRRRRLARRTSSRSTCRPAGGTSSTIIATSKSPSSCS